MGSDDQNPSGSSRRWFLRTVGTGTAVGIAGCTGGGGQETDTEAGTPTPTADESYRTPTPTQAASGETETEVETKTPDQNEQSRSSRANFVRAQVSPMTHLDPHAINDSTLQELDLFYDQLTDYAVGDPSTIKPMLATDWTPANRGKQWTFELRQGVTFGDGTEMDAYAVKRSLERAKQLSVSQAKPYGWIDSIQEDGKYEITINAAGNGFGPAPAALTFITTSILNPNVMDEHWEEENQGHEYWKNNTHGTGAWEWEDGWTKGETNTIVLKEENNWRLEKDNLPRNLAIWDEANVTEYTRRIVREAQTQKLQLGKGDIDFTADLTWAQIQSAADNEGVVISKQGTSMMNHYVFMHNQRQPTSDVNFRKALTYATDYESIAKNVVGAAKPWGRPWSDIMWPKMDQQYRQDMDKAKEFLDKSVYDGRELEWVTSTGPTSNKIAQAMTAQFNNLGVNVEHRGNVPWSQAYERIVDIEKQADIMNYFGWPDYIDPNGHAIRYWGEYWPPAGWNTGYYKNEEYDELYIQARETGAPQERADLYQQMQQILMDEVPFIWPVMRMWWNPVREEMTNFHYTPGNLDYLRAHQFRKEQTS